MMEIGEAWQGAAQCGEESEGKRDVMWRGRVRRDKGGGVRETWGEACGERMRCMQHF